MIVDFVTRSDSEEKFGGDMLQLREYVSRLERHGFSTRVVPFRPEMLLRRDAIVHILNVDRPYDLLSSLRQAQPRPIVVSSIHHSLVAVRRMRRSERGLTGRALIGRVFPEAVRELLAFAVRAAASSERNPARTALVAAARASIDLPQVWRRVGSALDRVAAVALLAEGEGDDLRQDTGWLGLNGVTIPNGLPLHGTDVGDLPSWVTREIPMVVVGRIEPRKRQAELAEAAARLGAPLVFAGEMNANSGEYGARFLRAVDRSAAVRWLGRLPHEETVRLMGKSKVLVNASWVEVQSLVDIEACYMGCHVVCTPFGNSREWLGDAVHIVDGSPEDVLSVATQLAGGVATPNRMTYSWTWDDSVERLVAVYQAVRSGRPGT